MNTVIAKRFEELEREHADLRRRIELLESRINSLDARTESARRYGPIRLPVHPMPQFDFGTAKPLPRLPEVICSDDSVHRHAELPEAHC